MLSITTYRPFNTESYYVINKDSKKEKYRSRANEKKTAIHWGQRKLFLTVLQFMTLYVDLGTVETPTRPKIVYAGAAPGHNIALLAKLFPTCEFHLYDTNPFSQLLNEFTTGDNPRVTIYKQYFLDDDARRWTDQQDVYFISDIRRDIAGKSTIVAERVIQEDMQMQQRWYELMRPKQAQFKFHLPYSGMGFETTTDYLDGTVYVQPWRGPSSTECRLVPVWGRKKVWNNIDYEDANFHINAVLRERVSFTNPITGDESHIDGMELTNDYDSSMEICIFLDYLKRFSPNYTEHYTKAVTLSKILTKTITFNLDVVGGNLQMEHLRSDPFLLTPKNSVFVNDEEGDITG